jgi:hypothetical protein
MGLIVKPADFIGDYELPLGQFSTSKHQAQIDEHEETFLVDLLGAELFDLFKTAYLASIAPVPTPLPTRFQVIFDPIIEDHNGCVKQNKGMKKALTGILYFYAGRNLMTYQTISGGKENKSDVANTLSATRSDLYRRYNQGIDGAKVIQWYIEQHIEDYPEYNGQRLKYASPY